MALARSYYQSKLQFCKQGSGEVVSEFGFSVQLKIPPVDKLSSNE
jgi:hypothetical protein